MVGECLNIVCIKNLFSLSKILNDNRYQNHISLGERLYIKHNLSDHVKRLNRSDNIANISYYNAALSE